MITQIGIAAGDIWNYLDKHGKTKLSDLEAAIDRRSDLILMSLGWLAREGHINVKEVKGEYIISLNE
jgi:hypothetical protein